jgi:hypothetical protein
MDLFLVVIDTLVIMSYILLIVLISPYMMRFIKKRNYDVFFQLLPVLSIILVSSIAICIGYGGFQETLFFQLTSIISFLLLLSLLFLTLMMKPLWKENYEKLMTWLHSFRKIKELSFLKAR